MIRDFFKWAASLMCAIFLQSIIGCGLFAYLFIVRFQ